MPPPHPAQPQSAANANSNGDRAANPTCATADPENTQQRLRTDRIYQLDGHADVKYANATAGMVVETVLLTILACAIITLLVTLAVMFRGFVGQYGVYGPQSEA